MANKFTQSILERQYKEAQEEKRAHKPEPPQAEAASEVEPAPPPVKPAAVTPVQKPHTSTVSSSVNLDDYIIKDTERQAKNKTFYLDLAVIEGIKSAAKKQKVTDSKLVNDILKKVLAV